MLAATFGWLCVETDLVEEDRPKFFAATFGWLCVETTKPMQQISQSMQPPSGGCVLKQNDFWHCVRQSDAATFGWLCVETLAASAALADSVGSHLRVAVC